MSAHYSLAEQEVVKQYLNEEQELWEQIQETRDRHNQEEEEFQRFKEEECNRIRTSIAKIEKEI